MSNHSTGRWDPVSMNWPHHKHSEFFQIDDMRWHVQTLGQGPDVLLVHGTGASTHSWADLATRLAKSWRVVMMDLPGHGFTSSASDQGSSLPGMAAGISKLVRKLELNPQLVVGHSAGAAVLAQMCLDDCLTPQALVSFNGAFIPFDGLSGTLYRQVAKVFSSTDLVPWFFSRQAKDGAAVQRLIDHTGSKISPQSADCYQALLRSRAHVGAALQMMANWDLHPMYDNLARLNVPLHLVACSKDGTVPVAQAHRVHAWTSNSYVHELQGLGHLGHEERPDLHASLLTQIVESPNNGFLTEQSRSEGMT